MAIILSALFARLTYPFFSKRDAHKSGSTHVFPENLLRNFWNQERLGVACAF